MTWIDITGYLGSLLSSITFIPQVYQAWKTKSVGDLNITMIFIVVLSTVVWLAYGFALNLWPVIVCNSIILILAVILAYFKCTFPKK